MEYRLNRLADRGGLNRTIYDPKYLKDGVVSEEAIRQAGRDPETMGQVVASTAHFPAGSQAFVLSPSRFDIPSGVNRRSQPEVNNQRWPTTLQLWQLLAEGRDAESPVPQRMDRNPRL
jgi:hypothetical protein